MSCVQTGGFAFNLVQYRTCNVPGLRLGKNSAICFHVKFLDSLSSNSRASSSDVNFDLLRWGFSADLGTTACSIEQKISRCCIAEGSLSVTVLSRIGIGC